MVKASCSSESSDLVNYAEASVPLSCVPVGEQRAVVSVEGPGRADLAREGLMAGSVLTVLARMPLSGPLVVQLGRTRLALSADVAAQVSTATPAALPDGR